MVKLFNAYYFMFLLLGAGLLVSLYFLLRNKSLRVRYLVVGGLITFNLVLHFLKLTFPPYSTNPNHAMREIWFINICGLSVLLFPFFYFSKNKTVKDYMFYLGTLSSVLALLYPTEALGKNPWTLDVFRFYITHIIIGVGPLLMIMLKIHTLDYKRIIKVPFIFALGLLLIMVQQVIQSELGIIPLRDGNFFDINVNNPSLIWGPTDDLAKLFTPFTPKFFKTVPWGEFKGQTKYWPFFWILPAVFFYFLLIPFLYALVMSNTREAMVSDVKKITHRLKEEINLIKARS